MSSADQLLQRLLDDAQSRKTSWINGPLDVVKVSHLEAIKSYEKTIAAQNAADDFKAEMMITVLFIAGGAMMAAAAPAAGALFAASGGTGARGLGRLASTRVGRAVVSTSQGLSNRTLVKFLWSGLSKESKSFLKKQAISEGKAFNDGLGDFEVQGGSAEHLYSIVKGQIDRIYVHYEECIKAVLYGTGTEEEKLKFATETAANVKFFRPVPDLENVRYILQRRFELAMYLNLILDSDKRVYYRISHMSKSGGAMRTRSESIDTRPNAPTYDGSTRGEGSDLFQHSYSQVEYQDIGNHIAKRINMLYSEEHRVNGKLTNRSIIDDDDWFGTNTNARVLSAADTEATRLMNLTSLQGLIPLW